MMTLRERLRRLEYTSATTSDIVEVVADWLQSDEAKRATHLAMLLEPGHVSDNVAGALAALARK